MCRLKEIGVITTSLHLGILRALTFVDRVVSDWKQKREQHCAQQGNLTSVLPVKLHALMFYDRVHSASDTSCDTSETVTRGINFYLFRS